MEHVKEILAGLAIFLVAFAIVGGIIGGGLWTAHENNVKQQRMNQLCLSHGYSGWQSGTNGGHDYGISGCTK